MNYFANDKSEEEDWLKDHRKEFPRDQDYLPPSSAQTPFRKNPRREQYSPKNRPIFIGKTKQRCPHCGQEASIEMFRDTKCLACQAADFLDPNP